MTVLAEKVVTHEEPTKVKEMKGTRQSITVIGMLCLLVPGSNLQAEPVVTGNTISWPDDGWYQVQSDDGSETFCNGGSSCEVGPGRYLVINHTTGVRFNDIGVGEPTTPTGISVIGNTISWPDDGWYQVQTDDGSETLCNGGNSCDVSPGRYLVINHTTGMRNQVTVATVGGMISVQDASTLLRIAHVSDFLGDAYQLLASISLGTLRERELQEGRLSDGTPIVFDQTAACVDGGNFYLLDETVLTNVPTETITYDECVVESTTFNGVLTGSSTIGDGSSETSGTIIIKNSQATIRLEHVRWQFDFSFGFFDFVADRYEVESSAYSFKTTNFDTVLLPDSSFIFSADSMLSHSFQLVELNGNVVDYQVSTDPGFMLNNNFSGAESGVLKLTGSGNTLEIEAQEENPSFYMVNFETADGSVSTDSQPWSEVDLFVRSQPD